MKLPTIYKLTNGNKVQEWTIEVDQELGRYRTESGQIEGKKTITEWTGCIAKNSSKSNATTPGEQALAEATAKRVKKLETGYMETIDTVKDTSFRSPMLADKYEGIERWPVYASYKYDGIRCIGNEVGLWSRKGKRFVSCPHLELFVAQISSAFGVELDGELYNHELREDFDEITSLVKKQKPTEEELAETRRMVQYHVYDLIDTISTSINDSFNQRYRTLVGIMKFVEDIGASDFIKLAPSVACNSQEQLDAHYEEALENGYEGQCIRLDTRYEFKRTKSLLKRKEFVTDEFPLAEINEGKGNRSGMAAAVWVKLPNGNKCKAGIKGGVKLYKRLWNDREELLRTEQVVTIRYQNYTPKGSLRFATLLAIRDYE